MPKLTHSAPKYRRHKPSGQAVVTIGAKDHYLGPWGSKASKVEYDRLIGEWLASGRTTVNADDPLGLTVAELCLAYWKFAQGYYVKDGKPTGQLHIVQMALHEVKALYSCKAAAEFGPLALRAVQDAMVRADKSRGVVNQLCSIIRRMFKWAASLEMIPVSVYQALATVPGLKRGRSNAREMPPVLPVSDETVSATLPHLQPIPADMVRLQRLTAARPDEICALRPMDVDRAAAVWRYRPESHKTQHHGRERIILIGPKAQDVLLPYLLREASAFCFVPVESRKAYNAERRANRQTPMTPSQARRKPKRNPRRQPGERYDSIAYRRAIHRACDLADAKAHAEQPEVNADERIVPRWSPNRLRHATATEIRKLYGLEGAQTVLGHAAANVTQIYAERDLAKAESIMREVG